MSWSEGGRLPSVSKISQSTVAQLFSYSTQAQTPVGLKSPGNKVVLSCVRFSHHDADDAETLS